MVIDTNDEDDNAVFGATWMMVSDRTSFFDYPFIRSAASEPKRSGGLRIEEVFLHADSTGSINCEAVNDAQRAFEARDVQVKFGGDRTQIPVHILRF